MHFLALSAALFDFQKVMHERRYGSDLSPVSFGPMLLFERQCQRFLYVDFQAFCFFFMFLLFYKLYGYPFSFVTSIF